MTAIELSFKERSDLTFAIQDALKENERMMQSFKDYPNAAATMAEYTERLIALKAKLEIGLSL